MSGKPVPLQFFETYGNRHDVEGSAPLFADDVTIYSPVGPSPMTLETYKQAGYAYLAGFPDLQVTVVEQLEDGNKVVSRVVWSGKHTGVLNGIPPTDRSFCSSSIFIDTVMDGKITERYEVSDLLSMMQQLGLIPTQQ